MQKYNTICDDLEKSRFPDAYSTLWQNLPSDLKEELSSQPKDEGS